MTEQFHDETTTSFVIDFNIEKDNGIRWISHGNLWTNGTSTILKDKNESLIFVYECSFLRTYQLMEHQKRSVDQQQQALHMLVMEQRQHVLFEKRKRSKKKQNRIFDLITILQEWLQLQLVYYYQHVLMNVFYVFSCVSFLQFRHSSVVQQQLHLDQSSVQLNKFFPSQLNQILIYLRQSADELSQLLLLVLHLAVHLNFDKHMLAVHSLV